LPADASSPQPLLSVALPARGPTHWSPHPFDCTCSRLSAGCGGHWPDDHCGWRCGAVCTQASTCIGWARKEFGHCWLRTL